MKKKVSFASPWLAMCVAAFTFLSSLSALEAAAQSPFAVDTVVDRAARSYIAKETDAMAKRLLRKWKKVNSYLPHSLKTKVEDEAVVYMAKRYVPRVEGPDSSIVLRLGKRPVGLVLVAYDGVPLGYTIVNEAGGEEVYPQETPDLEHGGGANKVLLNLMATLKEKKSAVVAGLGQPNKLFYKEDDGRYMTTDLETAQKVEYDASTQVPDYVYEDDGKSKPFTVAASIIGCSVTLGLIVLVALL